MKKEPPKRLRDERNANRSMEVFIHFRFVILRSISVSDCYSNRGADHAEHADETDDAAAVYLFHFVQIQFFHIGIHIIFLLRFALHFISAGAVLLLSLRYTQWQIGTAVDYFLIPVELFNGVGSYG